jgi:hypothetical protein
MVNGRGGLEMFEIIVGLQHSGENDLMATKYDVGHDCDDDIIASFFDSIPSSLSSMSYALPENDDTVPLSTQSHEYRIRLANTEERQASASILINRMYEWRGYKHLSSSTSTEPNRITLLAYDNDADVIGTISVGIDSPLGLYADCGYHDVLDDLRAQGKVLCEFNRLAMDPQVRNKRVLASLFHVAYLYPYGLFSCTDGLLEVNPRHARFYEQMLGFTLVGPERICPRVNAPSVLLLIDFEELGRRIREVGGRMDRAVGDRSLFPYLMTAKDSEGILGRLRQMAYDSPSIS